MRKRHTDFENALFEMHGYRLFIMHFIIVYHDEKIIIIQHFIKMPVLNFYIERVNKIRHLFYTLFFLKGIQLKACQTELLP